MNVKNKIPKTINLKTYITTTSIIILISLALLQYAFSQTYISQEENPWLTQPLQEATYIIGQYNSTHYYAKNHTGYGTNETKGYEFLSTNASYVTLQSLGSDRTIHFKAGAYSIDYDILSTFENFIIEGEGRDATTLLFGANGGFTLSRSAGGTFRENIEFRDLTFDGQGVAMYGIRSRSDASGYGGNVILRGLKITNCVFKGFYAVNAHALDIVNFENAYITDNQFLEGTRCSMIYLWQDGTYEAGNIHIDGNLIVTGYSDTSDTAGVFINSTGIDEDSGCGSVWVTENHFVGADYTRPSVAVKLFADNHTSAHNKIRYNRMEGCSILHASGTGSSGSTKYMVISHNVMVCNVGINIWLDDSTSITEIYANILSNSNSSAYAVVDDGSLYSSGWNRINDNYFYTSAGFNFSGCSEVRDNYGLNPLGVNSATFRFSATSMSYFGQWGNYGNGTVYTVRTTDMFLTVTGGTGVDIDVWDADDNIGASNMTSVDMKLIPFGYKFSITYTTEPTAIFAWT